jgi:hypothetical protein
MVSNISKLSYISYRISQGVQLSMLTHCSMENKIDETNKLSGLKTLQFNNALDIFKIYYILQYIYGYADNEIIVILADIQSIFYGSRTKCFLYGAASQILFYSNKVASMYLI